MDKQLVGTGTRRAEVLFGAQGGTRTRTSIGHYPLKIACLPVPPPEHLGKSGRKALWRTGSIQKLKFFLRRFNLAPNRLFTLRKPQRNVARRRVKAWRGASRQVWCRLGSAPGQNRVTAWRPTDTPSMCSVICRPLSKNLISRREVRRTKNCKRHMDVKACLNRHKSRFFIGNLHTPHLTRCFHSTFRLPATHVRPI